MRTLIYIAAAATGVYLIYRFTKKEKVTEPVNTTTNLKAKVRETTQGVIEALQKPAEPPIFPPQISKEYSLNRVIDAKTLIITNEIPLKTPLTMNDMVLRDKQIKYVKVFQTNEF